MQLPTFSALLGLLPLLTLASPSLIKRAALTQVTNFGSNPSNVKMYIYVPNTLLSNPAVVVAIHYCTGTASAYYSGTPYASLADTHGFIVIYPESPYNGSCWDVSSTASLTHNGGGNSNSIANMVSYVLAQYKGDASRVFVTGSSSGAMMTNVMAATYPELFKAATVYSGVPAGCFYTGTVAGWNSTCANGKSVFSQDVWRDTALKMYPGYTGARPKMLIMHGGADDILLPPNFNETMKQWSGVFGYTYGSPQQTLSQNPSSAYTRYVYGPQLEGIYGPSIGHSVPVMGAIDLAWFGITGQQPGTTSRTTAAPTPTTTSSKASTTAVTTTTPAPGGCAAARWAQCGGIGFTGCTACVSPFKCTLSNDWYSQCL